jgi:hypothetical protein
MFHCADAANVDSIRRIGLLSTNELLRRGCFGPPTEALVRAHRPRGTVLPSGVFIRDQTPMPPRALMRCLDGGISVDEWYHLVNDHVFFWHSRERAQRHLHALHDRAQVLLTIDVWSLVAAYERVVYLTPFNIGNARRRPARRGRRTLVPLAWWRDSAWRSEAEPGRAERAASHPPAELLVKDGVPDICRFIVSAVALTHG